MVADTPRDRFSTIDRQRFDNLELIGKGRCSMVFSALDRELDRVVALKLADADSHEDVGRYTIQREAIYLARVSHPNVIALHQAGWLDRETFALVLPYCPGTLAEVAAQLDRRSEWRKLLDMLIAAGRGLAALHELGILHRDIKPDNIMVDAHGHPQLADLGLACADDDEAALADMGRRSAVHGAEVLAKRQLDARSDLYAYCTTAFWLLYGRPPSPARGPSARAGSARRCPKTSFL
ncbi:MAG: protein kinase, partial [Deltaproteobacteria bacterium]|nr:protein kinase [Deltaproteobacteria bacterium]